MKRARVILADDQRMLREAIACFLAPDCDVVGQAADGRALLAVAQKLRPDIVVMDIGLHLLNGVDAARILKRRMPEVKIIFLTVSDDSQLVAEAFRAGASAYLLKNSAASELRQAVDEALKGHAYVTPLVAQGLVATLLQDRDSKKPKDKSTPRQREVLQLLAEGHRMKEIADILKITTRTVAFHKYQLMADHGIKSNAELLQFAVTQGVVSD